MLNTRYRSTLLIQNVTCHYSLDWLIELNYVIKIANFLTQSLFDIKT